LLHLHGHRTPRSLRPHQATLVGPVLAAHLQGSQMT